MTDGWAAMANRVLPRLLGRQAGARPGAQFLRIEDGGRGRDGGAPDGPAEVLAQAGLSDEELRAVAEDARRDGAFGFKRPPD